MRFAIATAFLLLAGPAAADLYRWVDPETGSTKFSSYPPPWYDDPAKQRRAPKVEFIPAGKASPATAEDPDNPRRPAAGAQAGKVPEELEAQRKAILKQMAALATQTGADRGQALSRQMESFAALTAQIDKLDPQGAAARNAEVQALLEKVIKGGPR
ncbi:MAG: DUF4124 domain-containing protein [Betaproteobacteria bacterium]